MSFTDEMQRLADHVRAAHESRAEAMAALQHEVTELRAGAAEALGGIHAEHRAMARTLDKRLSAAHAARHETERRRHADARRAARDRAGYVAHVRATTASMREATMSRLQEITGDQRGARGAWTALGTSGTAEAASTPRSRRGKRG